MLRKIKTKLALLKSALFGVYHNFSEREEKINPDIIKINIGSSVKNKIIDCYRIGSGENKILFISAIHGNEVGTVKFSHKLINWFWLYKDDFQNFSLYVIPCLNPDGYNMAIKNPQYFLGGRIGRFNFNNVDLNRSFNTKSWQPVSVWSSGKNYSDKTDVPCGKSGGSEPEVISLCDFIKKEGIKTLFSFHNVGRDVMPSSDDLANKLAKVYCEKTCFSFVTFEDWKKLSQTGTAREWCEENNISYIEIECPYRWGSDFDRQIKAISSCLDQDLFKRYK